MTYQELLDRINEKIDKAGILKQDIASDLRMEPNNLSRILSGDNTKIYRCLDLLDAVGLEFTFNGKPMKCHQDVIEFVDRNKTESINKISLKAKIAFSTANNFFAGENVRMGSVLKILEAMGIEVRVV